MPSTGLFQRSFSLHCARTSALRSAGRIPFVVPQCWALHRLIWVCRVCPNMLACAVADVVLVSHCGQRGLALSQLAVVFLLVSHCSSGAACSALAAA